jgi:iron complex outermembrane receptor protein
MLHHNIARLGLLLAGTALASGTAMAQEAAPAAPRQAPADDTGIADIVVYGQHRSAGESAQKVPIAITAVDARLLRDANTVDITSLGSLAPNVQTPTVGTTPGFPNFSIRGIGVNSSIRSVDPAVNIIQDGMVLVYQAGSLASTFDLEGVEILRGPQGVLFGRNATGGAISLRTRKPRAAFQLLADVSYGNFNSLDANASIEGRLGSDAVLGKLAVLYRRTDGYITNTNKGIFVAAPGNPTGAPIVHPTGQIGGLDELTIKPTFTFNISDGTELTLFTQYQRYNDNASSPRNFIPTTGAAVPLQTVYGFTPTAGKYETNLVDDGYLRLREWHAIGEMVNTIGTAKLTTIAAYRHVSFDSTVNLAGGPFTLFFFPDNQEDNEQYSFESRLNLPFAQDRVELTAGVYYVNSKINVLENRQQAGGAASPLTFIFTRGTFNQQTEAMAGFANIDWHVTDRLTFSAGGRYSSEKKDFTGAPLTTCIGQNFTNCPQVFTAQSKRWTDFSPRAVANFQAAEHVLLYASYTQGFRSGNFNSRVTNAAGFLPADPETVNSYELGMKGDFLDRTLRVNISGFREDYKDIQQVLTANIPGSGPVQTLINAASARIMGVEMEVTMQPTPAFQVEANFGYTDAKFQTFTVPIPGVADPTTLAFGRIPKYTVTIAANYHLTLPGLAGKLNARLAYDWRSSFYSDLQNTPELRQQAYGLLNANLNYDVGKWSLGIFARNLANVEYLDVGGRNLAYDRWGGQPRTFGVRATLKID